MLEQAVRVLMTEVIVGLGGDPLSETAMFS